MPIEIIFSAPQPAFATALSARLDEVESVRVSGAPIRDHDCDAVVSPANSFGFMDGGIDAHYTQHFGEVVQTRVRERILHDFHGELPVGSATLVETGDRRIPFLIAAPAMRVPMRLDAETVNPYPAMRAVLILLRKGMTLSGARVRDVVRRVAIPGLGTGIGSAPFETCARQVAEAIRLHHAAPHRLPRSWSEATEARIGLYGGQVRSLQ